MHIAPRVSVRVSLAFAILVIIVLSWILSTGIANYFNYLNMRSLHQQMLKNPTSFPNPIPTPKFGIIEFLTGRPPFPKGADHRRLSRGMYKPERPPIDNNDMRGDISKPPPMDDGMRNDFGRLSHTSFELRWLFVRLIVALGLAVLAGAWLGRKFTKPLMQLAKGAEAFHSGDFEYRIPASGKNEFTAVATTMNDMAWQVSEHIEELEKDAQRRRQFLADIAHELRSPVTTMRTMAGALQDGLAEEPVRRERAVAALARTSERMLRLVQDLMELANLDLNELPLNLRQTDIRDLIESTMQSYDAEAATAGVILHPLEQSDPIRIMIDPDRITQVLVNIIGNAVNYAGNGAEVKVSIMEDGDSVRIEICDTGKGIPAKDMPYVLDPFYRADSARTPSDCHSGLGLSIASRLIEAHGGKLTISSEEGKGTRVSILLLREC